MAIAATVECRGPTGVEMEALTAAAVGLLTVYDMLKAVEKGLTITDVAESEGCDLILIATRGRGAPDEVGVEVGSVTDRVVQSAHCPVFAVTVRGHYNAHKPDR